MNEKIPGGFDSAEVSNGYFGDNDNSHNDKIVFNYENPETMQYLREMRDAYAEKLSNLGKHINKLYKKADVSSNDIEATSLQQEADALFEDWQKIEGLLNKLESHTEITKGKGLLS